MWGKSFLLRRLFSFKRHLINRGRAARSERALELYVLGAENRRGLRNPSRVGTKK